MFDKKKKKEKEMKERKRIRSGQAVQLTLAVNNRDNWSITSITLIINNQ